MKLVLLALILQAAAAIFTFESNPGLYIRLDETVLTNLINDGLQGIPLSFDYDLMLPDKMDYLVNLPFKNNTVHLTNI